MHAILPIGLLADELYHRLNILLPDYNLPTKKQKEVVVEYWTVARVGLKKQSKLHQEKEIIEEPVVSLESAVEIVQSYAEALIDNRLYWTPPLVVDKQEMVYSLLSKEQYDKPIQKYLSWWAGEQEVERTLTHVFSKLLFSVVVYRLEKIIGMLFDEQDDDALWHTWHTRRMGYDLALEKGKDYRAVAFEKQVLARELIVDTHIYDRILKENGLRPDEQDTDS